MPFYSLETIREVAEDENKIIFLGRKVEIDIINLGYFQADVAACIKTLHLSHFSKTLHYGKLTFDVYKTKCLSPSGKYDDIYIKLKLNYRGDLCVEIGSFHL